MAMELRLTRVSRTYRPGEVVSGVVVIGTAKELSHNGLMLNVSGAVKPQVSASTVGIFESFYSSVKPVVLLKEQIMLTMDPVPSGTTEVPFEFRLEALPGQALAETYHGVYINVTYDISCVMSRSGLKRSIETDLEFVVEVPSSAAVDPDPVSFTIEPDTLENIKASSVATLPRFKVSGVLNQTNAFIQKAFTGEIVVDEAESAIDSIELQLVRVESISYSEGQAREATEIQNLQVADGDISRGLVIPIHMLFPRLFTCPTSVSDDFSVEFEVNVIVRFRESYIITENFPIVLVR